MTSGADVNPRPSSLSDARPEGPASVDGRVEWLATHGHEPSHALSGTKTFAENVAHIARGTAPRGSMSAYARIRALRPARRPEAGALERATPKNHFTPADVRARAEGL
jgi:hypothetical protein